MKPKYTKKSQGVCDSQVWSVCVRSVRNHATEFHKLDN